MKKFEEMTVVELKALCKKKGFTGYSKFRKAELIDLLVADIEAKKAEIKEAKAKAKLAIGSDFNRAEMFYKKYQDIKKFTARDWNNLVETWSVMKTIINFDELSEFNLTEACSKLACAFGMNKSVEYFSTWSEEGLKDFLHDGIDRFMNDVYSERLHKECLDLVKIDIQSLTFDFTGNTVSFDSRRCYDPAVEAASKVKDIPVLKTAESGASRTLREMGIKSIDIKMNWPANTDEDKMIAEQSKRLMLSNGIFDVATGITYFPAIQSPSQNRKATATFVQVYGDTTEERIAEVQKLWCNLTGFATWEDLVSAFADKDGNVVMAKLVARIATRGSNSLSIKNIDEEIDTIIKQSNVVYVEDKTVAVTKTYMSLDTDTGSSELHENETREMTVADGQALASVSFGLHVNRGMRLISKNEYDFAVEEWNRIGKDLKKVKIGSKLDKVLRKCSWVFQIRHGEKKGLIVIWNTETINELAGVDVIIPDSVRKFVGAEWSEYDLEICNYLKARPKKFAFLNPQFISALEWENPNALIEIVQHWEKYQNESVHDIAKAMEFHGMLQGSDEDGDSDSTLVEALRTHSSLINDFQVINWRKDQYRKFNDDMSIGRLMIPGQYTYMVYDPAFAINAWFGLDLHCLDSKTFYYNGKDCEAGLFRSPMIAPFEAQKVQLVEDENYSYLANCVIFNGYDATADDMGGGDHDGDQCLITCGDTDFGRIVIDGIREDIIVWEKGKSAQKTPLTWEGFIEYLITNGSVVDRTGPITNYGTKALDIANHLRSCIHFAKELGCTTVSFIHPRSYGKGLGWNAQPRVMPHGDHNTFACKALIEAKFTKKAEEKFQNVTFNPADVEVWDVFYPYDHNEARGMVGEYSFIEIEEEIKYYMNIVRVVRLLQGEEIDGAKTGFHPEIADFVKISCTPVHMLNRQEVLGRDQSVSSRINCYTSLSPLGRVYTYTETRVKPGLNDIFEAGSSKSWVLRDLLFEPEEKALNQLWTMTDGTQKTLIDMVSDRKTAYNKAVYNYMQTGEDTKESLRNLKETEINALCALANSLNTTIEVVAVACYMATYTKDEQQSKGLTYAWLLAGELLSVFSRGNKQFRSVRLPKNTETVCIKDNVMYVNDNAYIPVNAYDGEVPVYSIKGSIFGLVHVKSSVVVEPKKTEQVPSNAIYTVTAVGFKYHGHSVQTWKQAVAGNGYAFDIDVDSHDRPVIKVNGEIISAISNNQHNLYDLKGHTVKVVNNSSYAPNETIKESAGSISNLKVMIQ